MLTKENHNLSDYERLKEIKFPIDNVKGILYRENDEH